VKQYRAGNEAVMKPK